MLTFDYCEHELVERTNVRSCLMPVWLWQELIWQEF